MNKIAYTAILLISFCLAVSIGMLDYETKSLTHLFTAELGNVVMLGLMTVVFSLIGCAMWAVFCTANGIEVKAS